MLKIVPTFTPSGASWDHQGKSEISQIFISCSEYRIDFIQFAYVENGKAVLSERIGMQQGCNNLKTITFDYPSEYITRVSGCYESYYYGYNYLCSITFHTNKGRYGPYKPSIGGGHPELDWPDESVIFDELDAIHVKKFDYEVGGEFYGFFGTQRRDGIEVMGFYMKPLQMDNQSEADATTTIVPYARRR
ncbi:Jacalin-type lectin domain-containing protein [Heracleum sosnowskyi]|uniref:Jacalin-type lectin domain-containing protein n=1 Tax=Heracleum sosnowskyi TaxID=360622 RepID=A0AAD8IRN7_9APIA|nr:Jacalin-type lectin domain-containing protein [Heracleum sosnowskyi]